MTGSPLQFGIAGAVVLILALQVYRIFFAQPGAGTSRRRFILFGCRPAGSPSEHGSEVLLLAIIAIGVLGILLAAVIQGTIAAMDVAAFLLVLVRVVEAVTTRWTSRSLDRATTALANSPAATPPQNNPDQPPIAPPQGA